MPTPISPFRAAGYGGHPLRDRLQRLVDGVNPLLTLTGDGLIRVSRSSAGTRIGLNLEQLLPQIPHAQAPQVAIIRNLGPTGQADFSNEWYWLEPTYLPTTTQGSNTARALSGQIARFAAIHTDGEADHSHGLATDGTLRVEYWWEEDASGTRHCYFRRGVAEEWISVPHEVDHNTGTPAYTGVSLKLDTGGIVYQRRAYYKFPSPISSGSIRALAATSAANWAQITCKTEADDAANIPLADDLAAYLGYNYVTADFTAGGAEPTQFLLIGSDYPLTQVTWRLGNYTDDGWASWTDVPVHGWSPGGTIPLYGVRIKWLEGPIYTSTAGTITFYIDNLASTAMIVKVLTA